MFPQRSGLARLLRRLCGPTTCEVVAHPAVEATLFHQPTRRRYVLSLRPHDVAESALNLSWPTTTRFPRINRW